MDRTTLSRSSANWDDPHNGGLRGHAVTGFRYLFATLLVVGACVAVVYSMVFASVRLVLAQPPGMPGPAPQPVPLVLEDQFKRKADLADLRGHVVILVYGDRKATDACRKLGESLHVCWHPDAKGHPPAKAQMASVVPLEGLKPGQVSPNVVVVPVASCQSPSLIHGTIRSEIAKQAPDVVVWLDFANTLKGMFGQTAGEPNVAVFDVAGRFRMKHNGILDQPTMDKFVKGVQDLRYEGVR